MMPYPVAAVRGKNFGTIVKRILDQFTDSNGTQIPSHVISPINTIAALWTMFLGIAANATIQSNKARLSSATVSLDWLDSNAIIDVDVTWDTAAFGGLVVRIQDTSNYWQLTGYQVTGRVAIRSVVAGSVTECAGATISWNIGDTIHLQAVISQNSIIFTFGVTTLTFISMFNVFNTKFGVGCLSGGDQLTFDNLSMVTPSSTIKLIQNANIALTTPTYDGSGQAMHPDILDFGASPFNGYRYWMAMTPYPSSDASKENPSILVSNDEATWSVPVGLINPVEAAPGLPTYNGDPDLLYGQDGKLYLTFMYSDGSTVNKLYSRKSADGISWDAKIQIYTGTYKSAISQAWLWDGSQYVMWFVDAVASPYLLKRMTCATPDGIWSAPTTCTVAAPAGYDIWHINVVLVNGVYYLAAAICTAGTNGNNAIFALYTSMDGIVWAENKNRLLPSYSGWDDSLIYRASMIPSGGGFDLFYSAKKSDGTWHIGKTGFTV